MRRAILPICIRDFTIRTLFDVLFLEFFFILESNKKYRFKNQHKREIKHETNFVVGETKNAAKNLARISDFDFAPYVSTEPNIGGHTLECPIWS